MNFKDVKRAEYKENILFEVVFQARFPEIMRISREEPVDFQDIIRKEGYPESGSNIVSIPKDMPDELKRIITSDKEFFFFSEEMDWQVSLAKNFVALACKGKYSNYDEFKKRLKKILEIFNRIYEPSYFSRIGLRYQNIVNDEILPLNGKNIRDLVPDYIFPELNDEIGKNVKGLEKTIQLDDGNIKVNVTHALLTVSGKFGQKQISDKESYIIDIDCFIEEKIRGVDNVLTKCDEFKNNEWNIFQWSITEELRQAMDRE
ncbi:MAG: TIGR04255 family protein [Proteobacteria bacterium]|nr:TIGR04255 family protein [Pseudomonadota bacterium]